MAHIIDSGASQSMVFVGKLFVTIEEADPEEVVLPNKHTVIPQCESWIKV